MALCLRYHRQIIEELIESDGLLILGAGLGILEIIAKLVELHANHESLVFILNLSQNDIEFIEMRLMTNTKRNAKHGNHKLFFNVNGDISSQNRQNMYLSGGCIAITSRILVTDLLSNIVPFQSITGILVHNAHQLPKSANLSFVLEIFRKNNKQGFIKGFSEHASKFCGYTCLKDVMKRLFVSKVHIWPRFRSVVSDSFEERNGKNKIEHEEFHLELTDSMRMIQECVMEIIEGLLNELRQTTFISVSITVENGLFNDFEYILYVAFKPYWNKLSQKTKGLISDLVNLKRLLLYVVSYDALTFYRHLISMRNASIDKTTNIPKSLWLYTDSAEKLFVASKSRVYQWFPNDKKRKRKRQDESCNKRRKLTVNKRQNMNTNHNDKDDEYEYGEDGMLNIHLEINPKWKVVMTAIHEIRKLQNEHKDTLTAPVLIVCEKKCTAKQLSQIISTGTEQVMHKYWQRYLGHIAHYNQIQNGNDLSDKQRENNCLLTCYQRIKDAERKQSQIDHYLSVNGIDLDDDDDLLDEDSNKNTIDDPFIDLTNDERKQNAELLSAFEADATHSTFRNQTNDEESGKKEQFAFGDALDRLCAGLRNREYVKNRSKIIIHCLEDDSDNNTNLLLWQLRPQFVILYDMDATFVRRLETFHGYYPSRHLRTYLLFYKDSVEEQMYLSHLEREKKSALSLIHEKAELILPKNIDGKVDESKLELPSQQLGTSKRSQVNAMDEIIVDVREFRNCTNLPLLLYRENVNVIPVTLKVGDYILSPTLCVERKCISDLFSSMMHGRLYDQILQMVRYYEHAILLIEFDEKKPFSLQNVKDIPSQINLANIISKLVILTKHFNTLTILWSRSPLITTKIFKTLKAKRAQPDLSTSIGITNSNNDHLNEDEEDDAHTPKDILRSLPGVNHSNVDKILSECQSLKDLCSKSKDQLFQMLAVKDAKLLYHFLHTNFFNQQI
eukprot:215107_1